MDKIIWILLGVTAIITIYQAFFDSTRFLLVKFIRVLFFRFFSLAQVLYLQANDFTLDSGSLIDKRTVSKINEIGNELKNKTQISIYVHVKNNFGMKNNITTKRKNCFHKRV